jgi:hypothetical protein
MTKIQTRLRVARDGTVTGRVDPRVPPGEHEAILIVADSANDHPVKKVDLGMVDFPVDDCGPWPERLSLSRQDLYGDDGR